MSEPECPDCHYWLNTPEHADVHIAWEMYEMQGVPDRKGPGAIADSVAYTDSLAGEEGGFGDPQGLPPSEWEDPGTFSDSDSAWEERERAWARLPKSRPQPKVETIHSADLERTICVHELAFGIAVASGSDPAADEVPKAITQFAYSVFGWIDLMPPCEHKESR